jgi:hypothetical protein
MELFIQIRDGQPYEHPIFGDNFRQAFPDVDVNNLPPQFARFVRVQPPNLAGVYEVEEGHYEWANGVVTDVYSVRPMTDTEKAEKDAKEKQRLLDDVAAMKGFAEQKIQSTTGSVQAAWQDYLAQLNAWAYTDWKTPNVPFPPKFDANGNVISASAPGSAPDVIG